MCKRHTFSLIFALFIGGRSCWVFNNVNFEELAAMSGDEDFGNETDDVEIDPRFSLIFPGTKWCGAGNIADDFDDLGPSRDSDLCCREHDFCPDVIEAGETKNNLTNEAFYSRLSCTCDEEFRRCLRRVGSRTSRIIGKMYFNAIGTKCYRLDYPATGCHKTGGWLNGKCVEYEYDTTKQKQYQWFDVPNY